jgi:autotransporter-associated beta strand protein
MKKIIYNLSIITGLLLLLPGMSLGQLTTNTFTGASACPTNGNTFGAVTNATVSAFTRSSLTCMSTANVFNSSTLSIQATRDDNSYIEFSIVADAGFTLNLTSLSFLRQISGTANTALIVSYSTDPLAANFNTTRVDMAQSVSPASGSTLTWTFATPIVTGNAGKVTFRFYPFGLFRSDGVTAAAPGGTFRVDDVSLFGTVSAAAGCTTPDAVSSLSATNGNAQSILSWANGTCFDEMMVVASSSAFTAAVPTGNGTAYAANSPSFTDVLNSTFDGGKVVFKGSGTSVTVSSFTNGTQYNFKVFTRKGTNWTSGVTTSATPVLTQFFWDADGNTTTATGGTGAWDVSATSNWRTPDATGSLTTWSANTTPLDAVFAGTAGTVTTTGALTFTAPNFYFNTTGYTLATSGTTALTLAGNINLASGVNLTLAPNVNIIAPVNGTMNLGNVTGAAGSGLTIAAAQSASSIAARINIATTNATITTPIVITSAGGTGTAGGAGIVALATGTSLASTASITNSTAVKTIVGATSGNDLTINGAISGSADLQFSAGGAGGAGTVTLNLANTYTGATSFNAANSGVVKAGIANVLPTGTDVTMGATSGNGGIFDLNGFNQTVGSLVSGAGGGSIRNNGATDAMLIVGGSSSPGSFGLAIADGTTSKVLLTRSGTGTLILTGTNTYTGLTTVSGGTLQLNKTGGNTIPATNDIILSGGTLQVSSNQTLNNLIVAGGTLAVDAGVTLTINGTLTLTSGSITNSGIIAYGAAAVLSYNGLTTQTSSDIEWPVLNGPNFVTIGSNGLTLHAARTVLGILTLNGILNTGISNIIATSVVAGGSATAYVNGPINITVPAAANISVPVGKGGSYRPIVINSNGTTSTYTVEFFHAASSTPNNTSYGPGVGSVDASSYWNVIQTSGVDLPGLTLGWNATTAVTGYTLLRVVHNIAGVWTDAGANNITGNNASGTISSNPVVSLGLFTIGASNIQPLVIRLDDIAVVNKGSANEVTWHAPEETAGDFYELEKSTDGRDFAKIATVEAGKKSYNYSDANVVNGLNAYCVKMIGRDGASAYSKIVSVITVTAAQTNAVSVYPNPVQDQLNIQLAHSAEGTVTVTDITGKILGKTHVSGNHATVDMNKLAEGVYFVDYNDGETTQKFKIIK